MLWIAIITPAVGALYLTWQIQMRDLRGWQHYTCVTALIFLISILCLVASGKVKSFGLAGNTVEVVDQKLEEINALTEQNKRMARATAELVIDTADYIIGLNSGDLERISARVTALLKEAKMSDDEIKKYLQKFHNLNVKTNQPQSP